MQPHDDNQRPKESDPDWRRHTEQTAAQDADRLACTPIPDLGYRTVCLSAKLLGKGGAAA